MQHLTPGIHISDQFTYDIFDIAEQNQPTVLSTSLFCDDVVPLGFITNCTGMLQQPYILSTVTKSERINNTYFISYSLTHTQSVQTL